MIRIYVHREERKTTDLTVEEISPLAEVTTEVDYFDLWPAPNRRSEALGSPPFALVVPADALAVASVRFPVVAVAGR
jgi:hypothetical protein